MMENIRNVVFDLGGVLVELDIERCKAAFVRLGMPQVADLIDPYHPAAMIGRLEKGDIGFHEACEEMRRLTGREEVTDEEIADAYAAFLVDVPIGKLRLIDDLRRRGIRTCVLSNNNPASMRVIRRMFSADGRRMEDYFDGIYLSYEMRLLKPSEEIFRMMLADSGMHAEETLFIDDSERNVNAARALGFAVYRPSPGEDFSHVFEPLAQ